MWIQNLFKSRKASSGRRPTRRPASRLCLEPLEDRCLLSFSPAVNYPVGMEPQAMLTADFNADGRLDLAVANSLSSNVSVLLGNGDGTFQTALTSTAGYRLVSIAAGDFDADGNLDIATVSELGVSVLLGNGTGTFQAASNMEVDAGSSSVAVGDFNADGKLDLGVISTVLVYWDEYNDFYSPYANVLLGNGDGSFAAPRGTAIGGLGSGHAVVEDFNGDGRDDFVVASTTSGTVSLLLGDGFGNLLAPTAFDTGNNAWSLAAGDVDSDGDIDLVIGDCWADSVSVLLGDGLGGFGTAQNYGASSTPISVVIGDFDHDAIPDIATANGVSGNVSVLRGRGDGTFLSAVNSYIGPGYPFSVAAGDFNGDGWLDTAEANRSGYSVSVLINDQSWPPADAPTVSISDVTVTEGNTGAVKATFTVGLSAAYSQPVAINYATADGTATAGSDFQATSGTLTIPNGLTSATITVVVNGDRLAEPIETFFVNLSSPTNASISDGRAAANIVDDEPRISIGDATALEGNLGTTSFVFTVSLSAAYDAPVTVEFASANDTATGGSDYQVSSGTLVIPAAQTTGTITVLVNGDRLGEANETYFVSLSSPTNAAIADGQGVGTIVDDEPRISISDVTKLEGKRGQTTLFVFTVTLSAAYDQAVTLSFRTVDGTATSGSGDYVARTGTLTFAPGETTKTITIEVKGDSKREADETFYLDLFANSGNSVFIKNRGVSTILNDD